MFTEADRSIKMITLDEKLNLLKMETNKRKIRVMIIGLGSVGCYLLDYLLSSGDTDLELFVVGRNAEKMQSDVNIVRVATLIRRQNRTQVKIKANVDLDDKDAIADCIDAERPDIIINSSRAYSGLKYGSISWNKIRAYGIWAPLSIKYIRNIMEACEWTDSKAIVVNTSYSDVVIPWMKSAGRAYPDFGSGNINHLIPRMEFALAEEYGISDYWNINITYAVAHFHDVVISKEGQAEGVKQLIHFEYGGREIRPDITKILAKCKIPMPVDAKRNMMNASSNYDIIQAILAIARGKAKVKLHCPGVFGEIGGYPIILDSMGEKVKAYIDDTYFTLQNMRGKNRESIYLDGIKDIKDGVLYYTPELLTKVKQVFGVELMSTVRWDDIDKAADFLVSEIIEPTLKEY